MPHLPDLSGSSSSTGAVAETTHTPFRLAEKHYKNRSIPGLLPSLRGRNVLDLSRPDDQADDEVWRAGWWSPANDEGKRVKKGKERHPGERPLEKGSQGLKEISVGARRGFVVADGCILIPQYLKDTAQMDLLRAALSSYTIPPNPLSLDTHYAVPPNLFSLYATDSPELIPPLHQAQPPTSRSTDGDHSGPDEKKSESRKVIDTPPDGVVDYEQILAKNRGHPKDIPSDKLSAKTAGDLMRELRWANLGWVYKWTTKAYDFTPEVPIPFPRDLEEVCKKVVGDIPWEEVFEGDEGVPPDWAKWKDDYAPDTGIVNFYQSNDTLMGHVDRAELDPSRPLVSISLGHACIFLLGTSSRHHPPQPIILRSGDIFIMSGNGRQSYHGVPRIMEGTLPPQFDVSDDDDLVDQAVKRWIRTARVNINARQVFPPGFKRPGRI